MGLARLRNYLPAREVFNISNEHDESQLERMCFNCAHFFPFPAIGITETGICLEDPEFEPFLEQIMEERQDEQCKKLISMKSFEGGKRGLLLL